MEIIAMMINFDDDDHMVIMLIKIMMMKMMVHLPPPAKIACAALIRQSVLPYHNFLIFAGKSRAPDDGLRLPEGSAHWLLGEFERATLSFSAGHTTLRP